MGEAGGDLGEIASVPTKRNLWILKQGRGQKAPKLASNTSKADGEGSHYDVISCAYSEGFGLKLNVGRKWSFTCALKRILPWKLIIFKFN